MAAQQKLLIAHFQKCGAQVALQRFRARHPVNDSWVPMTNIIVRWNPNAAQRILLCGHYDTLPYPLMDPVDPQGKFVGANDNASGVAILMQLAHDMPKLKCKYGVDFVLLDGEEYIFSREDRYFLGSEYFAREYAKKKPCYRWGVLLDMVGATNLRISPERSSAEWRDTRPLVREVWATAARLGVREFVSRPLYEIDDDHLMLHEVGHIPCIDMIQNMPSYPPWHTRGDTPDKCSPLSLAKVGWVIQEWLRTAK
jgi:glutaminyl-peptide cyclotransferase